MADDLFAAYRVPGQKINVDYGPTQSPPSEAGWSQGPAMGGEGLSGLFSGGAYTPPPLGAPGGTDWTSVLARRRRNIMDQAVPTPGGAASQAVIDPAQTAQVAAAAQQAPQRYGTTPWQQTTTMNGEAYTPEMQNQWAGWGGVAGGPAQPGGYTTGPFPNAPQGGGAGNMITPPPGAGGPPGAQAVIDPNMAAQQTYTAVKQHLMQLLASGNAAQAQQLISSIRGF